MFSKYNEYYPHYMSISNQWDDRCSKNELNPAKYGQAKRARRVLAQYSWL